MRDIKNKKFISDVLDEFFFQSNRNGCIFLADAKEIIMSKLDFTLDVKNHKKEILNFLFDRINDLTLFSDFENINRMPSI